LKIKGTPSREEHKTNTCWLNSQNPEKDGLQIMNLGISLTSADDNTSTVKSSAGANHPGQMSPINVRYGSPPYNHSFYGPGSLLYSHQPAQGGFYT
jgi:hypothetical protein